MYTRYLYILIHFCIFMCIYVYVYSGPCRTILSVGGHPRGYSFQHRLKISKLINDAIEKAKQNDIILMKNSCSLPHYQLLKTHYRTESFLNFEKPWCMTRLIVQIRSNLSQFTVLNKTNQLNELKCLYDTMSIDVCTRCDS